MSMRNESIDAQLLTLRDRYARLEMQLADIQFTKQACLDEFMKVVKNIIILPEFPFDASFYCTLVNKGHSEHSNNKKLIDRILKSTISKDVKLIDEFVSQGMNMHHLIVPFCVKSISYRLEVPVIENIEKEDVIAHTFYNESYIDWNVGKLRLLRKNGSIWEVVWSGYSLHDKEVASLFDV